MNIAMGKKGEQKLACTSEKILEILALTKKPVSREELQKTFGLNNQEAKLTLDPLLQAMMDPKSPKITAHNDRYQARPEFQISPLMVVRVTGRDSNGDYCLEPVKWQKNRDIPKLKLQPRHHDRAQTEIGQKLLVQIKSHRPVHGNVPTFFCTLLERLEKDQPARITGKFRQRKSARHFIPDNPKIRGEFKVISAPKDLLGDGDPVYARIREDDFACPVRSVDIESLIWRPDLPASKLRAHILTNAGKRLSYPNDVEKAARRYAQSLSFEGHKNRKDIHFVTIDGQEANDFDDAVHAEPDSNPDNPGGYVINIASAHSALFLPVGSPMDRLAMQEPFSIYTNDQEAVHMLARCIAEHYASLKENEIRPAIVLQARIDSAGYIIETNFERQMIKVRHRMTYDRTDLALAFSPPYTQHQQNLLQNLNGAYNCLKARHNRRQDLKFTDNKIYPTFDDDGHIKGFRSEINSKSRDLIRKFMNLYNEELGLLLYKHDVPFISRYQQEPDPNLVASTRKKLEYLGIACPKHDHWSTAEMNEIMASVAHDPFLSENAEWYLLRTLKPAENALSKPGHFSLALSSPVVWGTSSERRYSDDVNQRALGRVQGWYKGPLIENESPATLGRLIDTLNYAEPEADKIQRDALYAQAIAHIKRHEGKTVSGFIVNVSENGGLVIKIDDCPLCFTIPISDLPKGHYIRSSDRRSIYNEERQISYTAGEWIDVQVQHADPIMANISLRIPSTDNRQTKVRAKPVKHAFRAHNEGLGPKTVMIAEILECSTRDGLKLRFTVDGQPHDIWWSKSAMPNGSYKMRGENLFLFSSKERPARLFEVGASLPMQVRRTKSGQFTLIDYVNNYVIPTKKASEITKLHGLEALKDHPLASPEMPAAE